MSALAAPQPSMPAQVPLKVHLDEWGCTDEDLHQAIVADAKTLGPKLLKIQNNGPAENRALVLETIMKAYQVMQAVEKREQEMALQENYYKLQQAHEYLKGEHKKLKREKEGAVKKLDRYKAQAQKEAEIAAARLAALEMKATQIPELEAKVAELPGVKERVAGLEAQNEALETGSQSWQSLKVRLVLRRRTCTGSQNSIRTEMKQERESFMHRKIKEWAEAGWLDLQKMVVKVARKAEEKRARQAARSASQTLISGTKPEGVGQDGEQATVTEREEEEEERAEEEGGEENADGVSEMEDGNTGTGEGEPEPEAVMTPDEA